MEIQMPVRPSVAGVADATATVAALPSRIFEACIIWSSEAARLKLARRDVRGISAERGGAGVGGVGDGGCLGGSGEHGEGGSAGGNAGGSCGEGGGSQGGVDGGGSRGTGGTCGHGGDFGLPGGGGGDDGHSKHPAHRGKLHLISHVLG